MGTRVVFRHAFTPLMVAMAITLLGPAPGVCRADDIYTFDAPNFSNADSTPILNRAPNIGDPTFHTTFTDPGGARVGPAAFNGLMMGPILAEDFDLFSPHAGITLTFNQPVTSLTADFAIFSLNSSLPGSVVLDTSAGSFVFSPAGNVGGSYQGGTVSFTGAAFTSATIIGLDFLDRPKQVAIDNVHVTQLQGVPEIDAGMLGGALTFLTGGVLVLRGRHRRSLTNQS